MKTYFKTLAVTAFAGIAALSTAALADAEDLKMLSETKVSLSQAIKAAEQHAGGTAYEASLDDDSFTPAFEVSVAKDNKSYEVRIDGQDGKVLGSREDND